MMKSFFEKYLPVFKYILVFLSAYLCILCGNYCYVGGYATDILIVIISWLVILLGYHFTNKIWALLILYLNLMVSVYIGCALSYRLYYENVSSDPMSLTVGKLMLVLALFAAGIPSLIAVLMKAYKIKAKKKVSVTVDESQ